MNQIADIVIFGAECLHEVISAKSGVGTFLGTVASSGKSVSGSRTLRSQSLLSYTRISVFMMWTKSLQSSIIHPAGDMVGTLRF